jgi:hypothetical protein
MNTFNFEFYNEMPLIVIDKETTAGDVDGHAEIEYTRDGDWGIKGIYIECYRARSFNEREVDPAIAASPIVEAPEPFNAMIRDRLENGWYARVQNAVNEHIESDREDAADRQADYRRDERTGLVPPGWWLR